MPWQKLFPTVLVLKMKESLGKDLLQHCVLEGQGMLEWTGRVPRHICTHISKNRFSLSQLLTVVQGQCTETFKNCVGKNPTRFVKSGCICAQVQVCLCGF